MRAGSKPSAIEPGIDPDSYIVSIRCSGGSEGTLILREDGRHLMYIERQSIQYSPAGYGTGVSCRTDKVVQIFLLGDFRIEGLCGADLAPRSRKARCLAAFLALAANGRANREKLAGLLWSRHAEEQARASLRQGLKELRRQLKVADPEVLSADRQNVRLCLDRVWVDALELV